MTLPPTTPQARPARDAGGTPTAVDGAAEAAPARRRRARRVPLPPPPRPTALVEGAARLRAALRTEPGRLRVIGGLLAVLLLAFGAVTAWQVSSRIDTATAVREESQPLSADAAALYRSLADANTTAAVGFLAGDDGARPARDRYEDDIRDATHRLLEATAHAAGGSEDARRQLTVLAEHLPVYTGLVEAARANDRQGYPLGGAYLRYADARMQDQLLPAAERLHALEHGRLHEELAGARARPWAALTCGVLVLGVLGWSQYRHYRRTNRVLDPALLAATAITGLLLGWLAVAHTLSAAPLATAERTGTRSLELLTEIHTESLQARGDESLALVARGAGTSFNDSYRARMATVLGPPGEPGGLVARAGAAAGDDTGRALLRTAAEHAEEWRERNAAAMAAEDSGAYEEAVERVTGGPGSTGESFDRLDAALEAALHHERQRFAAAVDTGRARLEGLPQGAFVLAGGAAGAALLGIGRRLSEYR
ncbi:hypothetical protein [Streptomyces bohaiensis]|uniref:hypothetical protein n=1 Tax=Streptomyces bohaiensis TaxID=1431344 RepID=UPI003B8033A4